MKDDTKKRDLARKRKAAQRARQKEAGVRKFEIDLPLSVLERLARAGEILGTCARDEAEVLLVATAQRHLESAERVIVRAGELWLKAQPFVPYARFLSEHGACFRVRDRVLTNAEWQPIYDEMMKLYGLFVGRGWTRKRFERFLKSAAKQLRANEAKHSNSSPSQHHEPS